MTTMIFMLLCATALVINAQDDSPCDAGWIHYETENTCLLTVRQLKLMHKARVYCQQEGGDLVQILDAAKNLFVGGLMKQHQVWFPSAFIGVYQQSDDTYALSNGTKLPYSTFAEGEPQRGSNRCVYMYNDQIKGTSGNFNWYTRSCDADFYFTCEKSANKALAVPDHNACGAGWVESEDPYICLKVVNTRMSFDDARGFCQQQGGDLITMLDNKQQRNFVKDLLKKKVFYWIGIRNIDGNYMFVDGGALSKFQPFKRGEPNNKKRELCVEMKNGRWYNKRCSRKRTFICQKSLSMGTGGSSSR